MNNQIQHIEKDEIDLRELWDVLAKKKYLILTITFVITLLASIYSFSIKPTYTVKAVVKIAHIGGKSIEEPEAIIEIIKAVYINNIAKDETTLITNISNGKKAQNFLSLEAQALSNNEAEAKINEVIFFIQNHSKEAIKQFQTKNNNQIKQIERDIKNSENILLQKIDNKIALLKNQDIKRIDDKITLLKNQDIKKIDDKITLLKDQDINAIIHKIKLSEQSMKEYTKSIKIIQANLREKNKDISFSAMLVMQLTSYQNMLFSLQTKITDLNLQKDKILSEAIPNLKRSKEKILNETIPNLERNKEKITQISIKDLERQKEQIISINIPNQKDKIEILKYNQSEHYIYNAKVIGKLSILDYPVKQNSKLIVVVAFTTALIFSIFLVFFLNFISTNIIKNEK